MSKSKPPKSSPPEAEETPVTGDPQPDPASAKPAADGENGTGESETATDGAETTAATPMKWREADDPLRDMMASNFIEYASYVIKDRAIPDIDDGLKPVQRRILHALWELDDGRFHKVANIIGHTMRYHPHGDASIGSALVVLANKEYYIDKQGNFGNIYTGDEASAARYIECRLSPLAREVMFNPEITEYVDSYDGRNKEPVVLPAKVPSLLMLGADGIAVGMTTRILPHNFCELLKAQIAILRDEPFHLYPDFQTGGIMDVDEYDDGAGRVRIRAKIDMPDDKTLVIREIPASTSTEGLITSIEDAVRRGKLKISSINDYTAEKVEVEITLPRGVYAEETLKRLYGYTDCEINLTSNLLLIKENRPVLMRVSDVLRHNTEKLLRDLQRELEIELGKLHERFHEKTLAQIFIENRIYKRIEKCETYEQVLHEVREGLDKFRDRFRRDVTDADIEKLLQLQIRRISLFDINKNRQELDDILKAIDETQDNLKHLKRFTISYITNLLKKYGPLFPRKTQIADLAEVNVREVALKNIKVGHDRATHFVGSKVTCSNKNDEPLVCSEFDRLVLLRNDGVFKVVPVQEKIYAGPLKMVLLADKNQVYSMIYRARKTGGYFAKRFRIDHYIMDKEYEMLPDNCIIEALYSNYGVVVQCEYVPKKRLRVKQFELDFEQQIPIRACGARGFKIATQEIARFIQVKRGSASPQADADTGGEGAPTGEPPAIPATGAESPSEPASAVAAGKAALPPETAKKPLPGAKAVAAVTAAENAPKTSPTPEPPPKAGSKTAIKAEKTAKPESVAAPLDELPIPEGAQLPEKPDKVSKTEETESVKKTRGAKKSLAEKPISMTGPEPAAATMTGKARKERRKSLEEMAGKTGTDHLTAGEKTVPEKNVSASEKPDSAPPAKPEKTTPKTKLTPVAAETPAMKPEKATATPAAEPVKKEKPPKAEAPVAPRKKAAPRPDAPKSKPLILKMGKGSGKLRKLIDEDTPFFLE